MIAEATLPKSQPPAVVKKKRWRNLRAFVRNPRAIAGMSILGIFVFIAVFAPWIARYNPQATEFLPSQGPSAAHWFGTTNTGQDLFSQFVWGTQTTLLVGFGGGAIQLILGLTIGMYGGYKGGVIDAILNVLSNIFLVLPALALLIVIESYIRNTTPLINGLIIGLTGWAWGARVFRAQTMSLVGRDFVVAAKLSGQSDWRIMFTEILPNMYSIAASSFMYSCLGAILAEAGLAYLGLENLNSNSWGTILYWAFNGDAMLTGAWYWFVPPGLAIALVGMSFALMNFAMDQITNPRLNVAKRRGSQRDRA
ncbi:ABC transporter permease [Ferroacidibacillus organovorans]|uniref:ABC transporter permease n=1 Tax=Ferroacidibacillus organovorans TaxID=1765683 RepID=UPI001FD04FFE|nr:ABC transporter permease [Ferroacidibacillus organovorans]